MSDDDRKPTPDVEVVETLWKCLLLGGGHWVAPRAFPGWVCACDHDGRSFAIRLR